MTERRNAEQALLERRRLVGHLVDVSERERRRIAWAVHDESIQSMVAVGMRLQLLAGRPRGDQGEVLGGLNDSVQTAVRRLRALVSRLRPPALDQQGLVEALTAYLDDVSEQWGLEYSLRHELPEEPSEEAAITLYRICQEALSNVHRHARATRVDVDLSTVSKGTLMRISDNGVGTDVETGGAEERAHFGLIEMRERAEAAHGWWSMTSEPGAGTTVEVWLPILPDLRDIEEEP